MRDDAISCQRKIQMESLCFGLRLDFVYLLKIASVYKEKYTLYTDAAFCFSLHHFIYNTGSSRYELTCLIRIYKDFQTSHTAHRYRCSHIRWLHHFPHRKVLLSYFRRSPPPGIPDGILLLRSCCFIYSKILALPSSCPAFAILRKLQQSRTDV